MYRFLINVYVLNLLEPEMEQTVNYFSNYKL